MSTSTSTSKPSELTGDYVIDAARTRIAFVARHTMSTRVRGRFEVFTGGARLDGEHPSESGVWLTVQAGSVRTGNRQRDQLLRGKFLEADRHPALTFTSVAVAQLDEARYKVAGDLAIRGVSRPVTLNVALTGGGTDAHGQTRVGFTGSATVDRKDWGVNWNAATALMISPRVVLEFEVTAVRES